MGFRIGGGFGPKHLHLGGLIFVAGRGRRPRTKVLRANEIPLATDDFALLLGVFPCRESDIGKGGPQRDNEWVVAEELIAPEEPLNVSFR